MLFSLRSRVGLLTGVSLLFLGATATTGCKKHAARQDPTTTSAAAPAAASTTSIRLTPAQGELTTLVAAEVAKAKARNLKPFVELRADWCGPCKELEASMADPRMVDAFAGTYLITLDADQWQAKQLSSLRLSSGSIPAFFELDDTGKATGRKITGGAWAENVPANMAGPLKAFFAGKGN